MAGRKQGKHKKKRAGRIFSGLVVEGIGFLICFWILISVWSANGGNLSFFFGVTDSDQSTAESLNESQFNLSALDSSANLNALNNDLQTWNSGWDQVRIRP